VSPKQLQPWAQVNHILGFKITHQVDINFPVGWGCPKSQFRIWVPNRVPKAGSQKQGSKSGSQIRVPNWGPRSGSQIGVPKRGLKSGSQRVLNGGVPNLGPKSGSKIGLPNGGPKSQFRIRSQNQGSKLGSQIRVPNRGPKLGS
jgi:hypothetical protein